VYLWEGYSFPEIKQSESGVNHSVLCSVEAEDVFFRYFRMSTATFDKLLVLFGPSLTFQITRMRKSVPPGEKLTVTLS
jgi:hypothetical protein